MRGRGRRKTAGHYRTFAKIALKPEISLPHTVIGEQCLAGTGNGDAAVLQHISVTGELERHRDVLLHEHAGWTVAVRVPHAPQYVLHDGRRETEGWFVEKNHVGRTTQTSADRDHLLFATG